MTKKPHTLARSLPMVLLTAAIALIFTATALYAEESKFRKRFIKNYKQSRFKHQAVLVKKSKALIPAELEGLLEEAKAEPDINKRLYLLDVAIVMATMHIEWNNGPKELLSTVEALQQKELKALRDAEEALKAVERAQNTPGNFVMNTHASELEAAKVAPVIYPHWVHRSFYRCKVCHTSIFQMKLGTNEISHKKIDSGELCGKCHDGAVSFDTTGKENCSRCHTFKTPAAKPLIDLSFYNGEKFEAIAKRVGSEWNHDKMPKGKFPLDKLKQINWVKVEDLGIAKPRTTLNSGDEELSEGTHESLILFDIDSTFMKDIVFSHKIHTAWIRCSICHPGIFTKELGANRVTMMQIKDGRACGTCHGRVSFTYKDCMRCHFQKKGEPLPEGTLRRPATEKK